MGRKWTPEQRKAASERAKANFTKVTEERQPEEPKVPDQQPVPTEPVVDTPVQDLSSMQKQIDQLMESNNLMMAAMLKGQVQPQGGVNLGRNNQILGEVDRYLVDPSNYPDPTKRLSQEPRLQTIAFNHNYELEYKFSIRAYETKTGVNMREPEFLITLLRVVLDDQGERVKVISKSGAVHDKFYIARRLMLHEDPQAALVIARENNIAVDKEDEVTFLNEMRYLRIRDWLFGYLWPKAAEERDAISEESVGGTLVQVYTKSSLEPSHVDFDKLTTKV